jgi:deazaflavin-dependent oxidoreductase (nitroreductase family)
VRHTIAAMTIDIDFDEMNRNVIAEFRANGGKAGGIFERLPLVLVHHTGARSGKERISPLVYYREDDRVYVFGSKGGADEHPAWYHNLVANPKITVEIGTETYPAVARVVTGADRDEIFAKQKVVSPQFAEYERKTSRTIPVVELARVSD